MQLPSWVADSRGSTVVSWAPADPSVAAIKNTVVLMVRIPYFPDELDVEEFADKDLQDPRIRAKPVVLATEEGFEAMRLLGENAHLVGPGAMAQSLVELVETRKIVCLRWSD